MPLCIGSDLLLFLVIITTVLLGAGIILGLTLIVLLIACAILTGALTLDFTFGGSYFSNYVMDVYRLVYRSGIGLARA